jgi:hypothetical protein
LFLQGGKQVNILGSKIKTMWGIVQRSKRKVYTIFLSAVLRAVELRHGGGVHHRSEQQESFPAHEAYNS